MLSYAPKGIVLSAPDGAQDVLARLDPALLEAGVPILALGGMVSALCRLYGGDASPAACPRGAVTLGLENDPLFANISGGERVLRSLSDLTLSECLLPLATATERPIGFRHRDLPLYALQYPIERNDPDAAQLLFNFASRICGAADTWDEDAMMNLAVERIRQAAPEGRVLCAVSGGVDSTVCARLASLAVGDRLMCVFVDTGLFRQGEPENVISTFMDSLGLVVAHVDASEAFLRALSGVRSRDDKERIAAQLMTQVLIKQLGYDPGIRSIVMGANLNDALFGFSASAEMEAVKGAYDLCVCEPVHDLFKEEVRRLATALSLPDSIALRQPFPASGLALRIFGRVTPERLTVLRAADACFSEEICQGGHAKRLWQYYTNLVDSPDQPDTYAISLRALQVARGGATAARLPFDVLERASERILSEVKGVVRVVYDLTPSNHYGEME